ncbi:hypothetical protein HZS_2029, partial [Henneguya salminicola]
MIKLSSSNEGIQKDIINILETFNDLKEKKLIGDRLHDHINYIKMYTHKECSEMDIQAILHSAKPDILDKDLQQIPNVLINIYTEDWSIAKESNKNYQKMFALLVKFYGTQANLVKKEYVKNYPDKNAELIKMHLIKIYRGIGQFFATFISKDDKNLMKRVCDYINKKISHSKLHNKITSNFMKNECTKSKIAS